ncbi:tRNA pseudouridine(38-40) synthase TruA [Bacillus alveayuensis]|jgi:tRNA pseudouridine38-40 synthase|uniref:tRNA pseudouridine synthase A n=1 Tax=Aeribacillus alveayuensis TaxID=279215 RepID=A0ABT9VSM4_9BACI|nr:tRNA pseudouridine(38-40) synthase TruA [Bacillus alveayuensis]MDQ0163991.1 tRNA pseudouridine38-40 synthase [Bacillus alveayuensis]
MRLKCIISYDGSSFNGFQIQPNERTVQGELQAALTKMHKGREIKVYGSGRTDRGVHAVGQVIHFDTDLNIPIDKWPVALNALLPNDILVIEAKVADDDFHARIHARKKEYRYFVHCSRLPNVFKRNYAHHVPYQLNVAKMVEASQYLLGTHDFSSFCSAKTDVEDKVRTLYQIDIWTNEDEVIFRFIGNGFLYNMVRILVGTLLEVGLEKRSPSEIKKILEAKDRRTAGKTAPGKGLYLWRVYYDN